jgi:hypothetical protein
MLKTILLSFLCSFSVYAEVQWNQIEDRNGLKLYSGPISKTGIYPFKAIFSVKHKLEHVVLVLADTSKKSEWVPLLSRSMTLEEPAPDNRVEYGVVDMPWPLKDRDAIVRILTKVDRSMTKVTLTIKSDQDDNIIAKMNIRVKVYPSVIRIVFSPDTGETMMEIETFVDPKGSIPKWIVNFFQEIEAKRMAKQMKRQLDKNLYSKAELNKVKELIAILSKKN